MCGNVVFLVVDLEKVGRFERWSGEWVFSG